MEPTLSTPSRKTFITLIITNGIIGVGDLGVATLLLFEQAIHAILAAIARWFPSLTTIIGHINAFLTTLGTHDQGIVIFYFLSHGVIKLFLAWALVKNRLWAYPLAIVFFGSFSIYQTVAVMNSHTLFDGFLLAFNLVVLWMVVREYRRVRTALKA